MPEERERKELPHPWPVEAGYLLDRLEQRIAATGYRLRSGRLLGDLKWIYAHGVNAVQDISRFLETPDDDFDQMLDAICDLNVILDDVVFHIRTSKRFRERLANHLGFRSEDLEGGSNDS